MQLNFSTDSVLLMTDGYKPSHWRMYPNGLEYMQSYFESRAGAKWPTTVFFGLQYYLKRYLSGIQVTEEKIQEAKEFYTNYFGNADVFNEAGWRYILENHGGKLPLEIRALPEGTVCPVSNALMTIENTDPKCAWLVNWAETLLVKVWGPCSVATQSREIYKIINQHMLRTGGSSANTDWTCHDFGYRGVSSEESAAILGAAHLLSFFGSDTLAGDILLRNYYHGEGLVSASIPASEHSTVTTWGEEGECDFIGNALKCYPKGLMANVIDSYNPERFIKEYATKYKDMIMNREGKYIFRPDSGDPNEVSVQVLNWLGEVFGYTVNDKGFKVLHPSVGMIYGDGMDFDTINDLFNSITNAGWAAQNSAIGSGGGLLQKLNRDTQRFAFKACWAVIDGKEHGVCKTPSTDPTKNSKSGYLSTTVDSDGNFSTINGRDNSLMSTVFLNGDLLNDQNLSDIRARVKSGI